MYDFRWLGDLWRPLHYFRARIIHLYSGDVSIENSHYENDFFVVLWSVFRSKIWRAK